jgi:predicted enzyme related to lactoylglutathione lyase
LGSRANAGSQLLACSDRLGRTQAIASRADLSRYSRFEWLDDTVALVQKLGGSIVRPKTAMPKTAWVTIVADPAKNIFGVWQSDPNAFPLPEPD